MNTCTREQEKPSQYQTITQAKDAHVSSAQLIRQDLDLGKAIDSKYEKKQWKRPIRFLLSWPFSLAWNTTWSLLFFAARFLPRQQKTITFEFIRSFELVHGKTHVPFFQGSYSQALEKSKRENVILLVVLQSEDHDDTFLFCRETLTSKHMIDYIKERNILVWCGNVNEIEAHKVSCALKATKYPFMALLGLKEIERIEGFYGPLELKDRIEATVKQHLPKRDPRRLERQLREEQDEAYYKSLEADQEKERKAEKERQALVRAKEKEKEELRKKEIQKEKREGYIRYLYTQLSEEPKEGRATKVSFRLADGERVVRLFSENDSLETLYKFIQVYPLLKANEPIVPCCYPQDYIHTYNFKILSLYPRREYEATAEKLRDQCTLWPSATLIVEEE